MIYKTLHRKLKIEQTDNTMVKEKEQKTINDLQNTTQKTKDWADGQYNGRMDKDKKTINDLQNTTQKTKDWVDGQYNGWMEKDKKTINNLQNTTQKTRLSNKNPTELRCYLPLYFYQTGIFFF